MSLELFNHLQHFNDIEKCQVISLINEAEKQSRSYGGTWTAPWLHSPLHSDSWRISKRHGARLVNGKLEGVEQINWSVSLPDGSKLTDSKNLKFLQMLQKIAFLAREAPVGKESSNTTTHTAFIRFLIIVAGWVYLHKDLFDPENELLSRIDAHALQEFLYKYSQGGVTFLLCYPERILTILYEKVFLREPSNDVINDPFCIPDHEREQIGKWLVNNNFITHVGRDKLAYLNRKMVAEMLGGVSTSTFSALRINAFLQYLTPGCNSLLLVSNDRRTEWYSHRVPLLAEVKNSKMPQTTLQMQIASWGELLSMKRHLPDGIPDVGIFRRKELTNMAKIFGVNPEHTPWIPLKTALSYTTESLRWVQVYGEDLVSLFLDVYRHFHTENMLDVQSYSFSDKILIKNQRDLYVNERIPNALIPLNISGCVNSLWSREANTYGDYSKLRSSPSLFDAMSVLIGAIITLLGITKPIRQDEICNLDRNCVVYAKDDGYWINHEQGKKNIEDVWAEDLRPTDRKSVV